MKIINNNIKYEVKSCIKFKDRLLGFMFKKDINKVLCFPKCNSIHTFFMLKDIDVIMTDKDFKILYIFKNLKPFKIVLPKKNVYYTFETKSSLFNIKLNEKLDVKI